MNKLDIKERNRTWYWSSTEFSSPIAWCQYFSIGNQSLTNKANSYWARAVRRVKVSR